ncbi:MAG: hypothetical protein N2Z76_01045 [Treponemataceae bacterium]|nr:hypothetical protein [Treponemataceae bacterium]
MVWNILSSSYRKQRLFHGAVLYEFPLHPLAALLGGAFLSPPEIVPAPQSITTGEHHLGVHGLLLSNRYGSFTTI